MHRGYMGTPIGRGVLDGDWRGERQYYLLSSSIVCLSVNTTFLNGYRVTYVRDMKVKGACLPRNLAFR